MGLLDQLAKSLIGGVVVSIHLDAVVDGGSIQNDFATISIGCMAL